MFDKDIKILNYGITEMQFRKAAEKYDFGINADVLMAKQKTFEI